MDAPLSVHTLAVRVGNRELVRDLSLQFGPGEFVAVLGRNGCGKTLTLHTLAGLRAPATGAVNIDGIPLLQQPRRAVARRLGLLAQDVEDGFAASVMETVLIGRHPHLDFWQWETAQDERLARDALAAVDLGDFAGRRADTLSGGEQRRLAVAALLAQQPGIFLVDEPTNHLDPHHQLAVLKLFRALADAGNTVIATLHDPTLAARFADRVVLLFGDGRWHCGPVSESLSESALSDLYLTPMTEVRTADRRIFVPA